jgi:chaperonin GroEL (HSP60 family)
MAEGSAGRERLAMESFARALETIPFTLASNAGKEGLDTVLELRATLRNEPQSVVGIMSNGEVGEVPEVLIPAESLISAITGAFETASSLLRVDQVISARGD